MNKLLFLLLSILTLTACRPPQQQLLSYAQGASMAYPVMINETSETKGIAAEYQWIRDHYTNYKLRGQRLVVAPHGRKYYDVIAIEHVDGTRQDIYFDINKFYGKHLGT